MRSTDDFDPADPLFWPEDDEDQVPDVACRQCGTNGLYWRQVGEKWRLYDERTDKPHACIVIRRRDDQARTRKV